MGWTNLYGVITATALSPIPSRLVSLLSVDSCISQASGYVIESLSRSLCNCVSFAVAPNISLCRL